MVLPLLHGPTVAGRGRTADKKMAGDAPPYRPVAEKLPKRGFRVPAETTPNSSALGLRRKDDVKR